MSEMGNRIRERRQQLGLSLEQLAKKVGCSKQTIGHYETGSTKTVSMNVLFPLADVLDVSARWLATGEGEPKPFGLRNEHEKELVATYRTLPPPLQEHLLQTSVSLASSVLPSPPYPKPPQHPPLPQITAKKRR